MLLLLCSRGFVSMMPFVIVVLDAGIRKCCVSSITTGSSAATIEIVVSSGLGGMIVR